MGKKSNLLVLAGVMLAFATSCTEESAFNPNKKTENQTRYEEEFVQQFGTIAATQDWGFGKAATTRASNTEKNRWGEANGYDLVSPVEQVGGEWLLIDRTYFTDEKKEEIKALFKDGGANAVVTTLPEWTDFFVRHVYHNNACNMNQLKVFKNADDQQGEHVSNMNKNTDDITLMLESGTYRFSYESEGGKQFSNYITILFEGNYYIGFDYEMYMSDTQKVDADNDYSDWILKISPAIKNPKYNRIFAEDVGAGGDIDFNDVVFDAVIENGQAKITLLAAGGTKPIYIGGQEIHGLFEVDTKTRVNVGLKYTKKEPVTFYLNDYNNKTILDIPITVDGIVLTAEVGKVPYKICVPNTVEWTDENQALKNKYPQFADYVGDPTVEWWN